MVEFSIVASFLFLILFGIVDFGFAFNDTISVRQGAREGAREAVVGVVGTDTSCPLTGFSGTAGSDTNRLFCLVKDRVGLDDAATRVKLEFETGTITARKSLVVCVQHPIDSISPLPDYFLGDGVFKTEVQMRVEIANANLQEAEETALPGSDWTWCVAEATA